MTMKAPRLHPGASAARLSLRLLQIFFLRNVEINIAKLSQNVLSIKIVFKAKLRKKGALRVIERGALLSTTLGVLKGCAAVPKFFKDGA